MLSEEKRTESNNIIVLKKLNKSNKFNSQVYLRKQ